MPKRNAIIIANPTSGRGAYSTILPYFETEMKKAGWSYEISVPDSEDEAREVAQNSLSSGFDSLIAVGGDGTVHTVLEGMDIEKQALGIIPLGSGNDLFRMLKIKNDPKEAVDNVINGDDWKIDVGMCNGKKFLNTAGLGIDSETLRVRRDSKGFVKRNYVLLFLKTLGQLKPFKMRIDADGQIFEDEYMWVIACNNNYIGGGMMIAPDAIQDDGLLDLILIRKMSKPKMVFSIPAIFKGTFVRLPEVTCKTVSKVTLETESPRELGIDGDLYCQTPATITILPRVLSMIKTK